MDAFETLSQALRRVARANPGALGNYHLKLAFDKVIACKRAPSKHVCWWPVAPRSGSIAGLRALLGPRLKASQGPGALAELWLRLHKEDVLQWPDYLGTVGALLCWLERNATTHMDECVAVWEHHFSQLKEV